MVTVRHVFEPAEASFARRGHPARSRDSSKEGPSYSQLRPTRSQATSLGSHSVRIGDHRRVTFFAPHVGQGGAGLVEIERYSSNRSSHFSHRYS